MVGIFGFLILSYYEYHEWFIFGAAIDIAITLFAISLRLDRTSTVKMFALMDESRRRILEALDQDRTFEELKTLRNSEQYLTTLSENIAFMKKIGLIKERREFLKDGSGKNKEVIKFTRSF